MLINIELNEIECSLWSGVRERGCRNQVTTKYSIYNELLIFNTFHSLKLCTYFRSNPSLTAPF